MISSTFIFAWLVNFAQYMVFYLLVTIMALYAAEQFGANDTEGGFASSAFIVGATIARLFSGMLVDAFGRKRCLVLSAIIVSLACIAYIPAHSLVLLIFVRIVHGAFYAIASTAVMAVAQSVIPAQRRAEGTGYFALGTTLAAALGPAAGVAITRSVDYVAVFELVTALSVIAIILAFFLRVPEEEHRGTRHGLRSMIHPHAAPIGVFMLLVGVGYSGVITYINAYSRDYGLETGAGLFFIAYAAISLIMRLFLGRLQDRNGDNLVVYSAVVTFAIGLGLLAGATSDWVVVLAGLFIGIGYGSLVPASQAIAVRLVPTTEMGAGISTLYLLLDVGVGFGPIALGVLISASDYRTMYWVLTAVVIASGVVYLLVHGRSDNATAQAPEVILEAHEQQPAETPDMVVTDTRVSQEGVARTKDRGLDSE